MLDDLSRVFASPLINIQVPHDLTQQSGLARPILAKQTNTTLDAELRGDILEDGRIATGVEEGEVLDLEDRLCALLDSLQLAGVR